MQEEVVVEVTMVVEVVQPEEMPVVVEVEVQATLVF
jgi:hypothetical protein